MYQHFGKAHITLQADNILKILVADLREKYVFYDCFCFCSNTVSVPRYISSLEEGL